MTRSPRYRDDKEAEMVRKALAYCGEPIRRVTARQIEAARREEQVALELAYRYALERRRDAA